MSVWKSTYRLTSQWSVSRAKEKEIKLCKKINQITTTPVKSPEVNASNYAKGGFLMLKSPVPRQTMEGSLLLSTAPCWWFCMDFWLNFLYITLLHSFIYSDKVHQLPPRESCARNIQCSSMWESLSLITKHKCLFSLRMTRHWVLTGSMVMVFFLFRDHSFSL